MGTAVHFTLEEFLARPEREDGQREELIEGEVIVSPGAKWAHAMIVARLRVSLAPLETMGYVLANDFACILGRSMSIPDLAAVSSTRAQSSVDKDGWLTGSPELVIEVASPSNRRLERKADVYLEHGAEQVWIVYPKTKTVTVVTGEGTTEARMGEHLDFHGVHVPVLDANRPDPLSQEFGRRNRLPHPNANISLSVFEESHPNVTPALTTYGQLTICRRDWYDLSIR